jgi:hypothetical protein
MGFMTILRDQAHSILHRALESRIGIQIRILDDGKDKGDTPVVTPSLRVKQIFYRFRKEIGDIELLSLQIRLCPKDPNNRLWITKGIISQETLEGERE